MSSFTNGQCPWCGEKVNALSAILSKKTIGQCKKCKKYFELKGWLKASGLYGAYLFSVSILFKYILSKVDYTVVDILLLVILLGGAFVVLAKFIRVEKYKY